MLAITITESAQTYLSELLAKQDDDVLGVRMFVSNPGTAKAETCLAYCRADDVGADDEIIKFNGFDGYFEARSLPYLDEAFVDYATEKFGGQLTIKAPNAKAPKVSADSPIEDRINYALYAEVNPSLASHGGEVSLVEVADNIAILRFGGGCQGCGMVDTTLKDGVERTLMEMVPELEGVRDITDHSNRDNAYI